MSKESYAAKFLDPRWQKFRLKCFESAEWKCDSCDTETKTLNVHHPFYVAGREPWEYLPTLVFVLCNDCHAEAHARPAGELRAWEVILHISNKHEWAEYASFLVKWAWRKAREALP